MNGRRKDEDDEEEDAEDDERGTLGVTDLLLWVFGGGLLGGSMSGNMRDFPVATTATASFRM